MFLPGDYKVDVPIGFYTEVLGLGASPDDTHITGNVHVDASARDNNATTTFWRSAEGFSVTPADGVMQWAVSQAVAVSPACTATRRYAASSAQRMGKRRLDVRRSY